ncbi:hypothetical protein EV361DRAFT_93865 [Lentinula raphanica]|nr:hypothetical protein EV361DRAFT_93865 [Lentinula raphanica]
MFFQTSIANSTIVIPASSPSSSHNLSGGAIAGAVVGSLLGVALLSGAGLFIWLRRRRKANLYNEKDISFERPPPRMPSYPNPDTHYDSTQAPGTTFNPETLYFGDSKQRVASTIIQSPVGEGSESGYTASSPTSQSVFSRNTLVRSETLQLRNDVENLRREMAALRAAPAFEEAPPPQYA